MRLSTQVAQLKNFYLCQLKRKSKSEKTEIKYFQFFAFPFKKVSRKYSINFLSYESHVIDIKEIKYFFIFDIAVKNLLNSKLQIQLLKIYIYEM